MNFLPDRLFLSLLTRRKKLLALFSSFFFGVILLMAVFPVALQAQAPVISYTTPHTYPSGTAISPLTPTASGVGAVAGYSNPVTAGSGFSTPYGLAADAAGNVYVADSGNGKVKKIPAAGGAPVEIGSGFSTPIGVAVDAAGNVFVTDFGTGVVDEILVGSNTINTIATGFNRPLGIAVDAAGNLYVSDRGNNAIKKIAPGGSPVIIASGFNTPEGIAVDAAGNVYVDDGHNDVVKKIPADGSPVSVLADGFSFPAGLSIDAGGTLYVSDYGSGSVKKIVAGVVTTISSGYTYPYGVVADNSGKLYVTNAGNNIVQQIAPLGGYFISPALPAGLSFNSNTGVISGTPTSVNVATNYKITAYNAAGGSSANVTISVVDTNPGSADLNSLSVSTGTLSPAFASGITTYTSLAGSNVSSITVTPVLADVNASVRVNGTAVVSGLPSFAIPLSAGGAAITIVVTSQNGAITKTYTLTVSRSETTVYIGAATGSISACAGAPSASPNIEQFTVSGSHLTSGITATAPTGFQVSLAPGTGYGNSVTIPQTGGNAGSTVVYLRSSAAATGFISGNVLVSAAGATNQTVAVNGLVNASVTVNPVSNQTVVNGSATTAVNFTGTTSSFNWVNNTPGIGLAANGTGNIPAFTAVNNTSSPVTASVTVTPVPAQCAYIPDLIANNVTVINTATNSIVTTIPVGKWPINASVSRDGSRVYVANVNDSTISVINTGSNTVIATIPVGNTPVFLAVSPDGSRLYEANNDDKVIKVISTITNTVVATIAAGINISSLAVTPDGSRLYVVGVNAAAILVFNTATNTVIATIPTDLGDRFVVISPDGTRAYVVNNVDLKVMVINTATNAIIYNMYITYYYGQAGMAISPDGKYLYVANSDLGVISIFNTTGDPVEDTTNGGSEADAISFSPDGSKVYVIDAGQNITVIKNVPNQAHEVIATINVGLEPAGQGNFISSGTGCSGLPVTFTITINPSGAVNAASLSALKLSTGTLSPAFASVTTAYTATVSNATTSITVTPTASNASSVIKINGTLLASGTASAPIALSVGNTTINIVVTAPDGVTKKTYTVVITRPSNNAYLSNITTSTGTLSPAFTQTNGSYTMSVSNTTASLAVTPTLNNPHGSIKVNGTAVTSGVASAAIPLAVGNTTINIVVLAQDGVTKKTYTVIVTRLSNNVYLSNLTLNQGTLSPAFAMGTGSYTASVSNAVTSVTVTPTVNNPYASVKVNGAAVTSGTASAAISLSVGANTIGTQVTAQDGVTHKTYTITITRAVPGLNSLYLPSGGQQNPLIASLNQKVEANNILSPNGDGANDIWVVKNIAFYPDNTVTVYNRAGEVIFTKKGYTNDWNGAYRGSVLSEGTYYYLVDLGNGNSVKGFITVVMNR